VRELVDEGVTGGVFSSLDELIAGLPAVFDLDRARIREATVTRFGVDRMVDEYVAVYRQLVARKPR